MAIQINSQVRILRCDAIPAMAGHQAVVTNIHVRDGVETVVLWLADFKIPLELPLSNVEATEL